MQCSIRGPCLSKPAILIGSLQRKEQQTSWWETLTFTKAQKHPVIYVSSTQTIDPHTEESSVCTSPLHVSERERDLDRKHKAKICDSGTSVTGAEMERVLLFPPLPRHSRLPGSCWHRFLHPLRENKSHGSVRIHISEWFTNINC